MPIRIVIADDHSLVRQGLAVAIGAAPDLELVGQAANGEQAVELVRGLRPDVLILDLRMPVKDGLSAIPEIRALAPETRILVLTSFGEDQDVIAAMGMGAQGFLLKDVGDEELLRAIRAVHSGGVALDPSVAGVLVRSLQQPPQRSGPLVPDTRIDELTPSELKVLQLLTRGLSNQDLAAELVVSVRTITTHVRSILDKLQLANRTQAALYARECGILPPSNEH
jgi:DNA-binding NarL/FixJ family response regulator